MITDKIFSNETPTIKTLPKASFPITHIFYKVFDAVDEKDILSCLRQTMEAITSLTWDEAIIRETWYDIQEIRDDMIDDNVVYEQDFTLLLYKIINMEKAINKRDFTKIENQIEQELQEKWKFNDKF